MESNKSLAEVNFFQKVFAKFSFQLVEPQKAVKNCTLKGLEDLHHKDTKRKINMDYNLQIL